MAVQDTDAVISVAEAKRRLLLTGEQADAARRARGPLGTWQGKALVGGAAAALLLGLAVARPVHRLVVRPQAKPPKFNRWWLREQRKEDVKKAAVGGLSLGLVIQLLRPMLPHLTNYAAAQFMRYRAAKAAAAQNGSHGVRSAQ